MRTLLKQRFLSILCYSGSVQAGAWTQYQGHGQFILNGYSYSADERFDNNGSKQPLNAYDKYELNPYFEYGLTGSITVGANLSLQGVTQKSNSALLTNYDLGDSEFFAKAYCLIRQSGRIRYSSGQAFESWMEEIPTQHWWHAS